MARPVARKPRKAPVKEIGLHMSVAAFLRRAWPAELPWFHVPNGEKRDPATARKLKAMGVLPGVPDFALHLPNGQLGYIELKVGANGLSDEQIEFRDRVVALRCGYATCRTVDDVEITITRWLAAFGLKPGATLVQRRAA